MSRFPPRARSRAEGHPPGRGCTAFRDRAPCPPFEELVGDLGVELVVESALRPAPKVFVNDDERLRVHHPTSKGGPRPDRTHPILWNRMPFIFFRSKIRRPSTTTGFAIPARKSFAVSRE